MMKRTTAMDEANAPPEPQTAPGRPLNPATPDTRPLRSGSLVLGAARIRPEAATKQGNHLFEVDRRHADTCEEQARTGLPAAMAEIGAGHELLPEDKGGLSLTLQLQADAPI